MLSVVVKKEGEPDIYSLTLQDPLPNVGRPLNSKLFFDLNGLKSLSHAISIAISGNVDPTPTFTSVSKGDA